MLIIIFFFCINYNNNFCPSPDPDPWCDSVCVRHTGLLENEKNFNIRFFYLVTSQSCAAQKFGTIGHSYLGLQS